MFSYKKLLRPNSLSQPLLSWHFRAAQNGCGMLGNGMTNVTLCQRTASLVGISQSSHAHEAPFLVHSQLFSSFSSLPIPWFCGNGKHQVIQSRAEQELRHLNPELLPKALQGSSPCGIQKHRRGLPLPCSLTNTSTRGGLTVPSLSSPHPPA